MSFNIENTFGIQVPPDIKAQQDKPISEQELQQAIKSMKNSKNPGDDGIPADFYKVFWIRLKDTFIKNDGRNTTGQHPT